MGNLPVVVVVGASVVVVVSATIKKVRGMDLNIMLLYRYPTQLELTDPPIL